VYRAALRAHKKYMPAPLRKESDRFVRTEFNSQIKPEEEPKETERFLRKWEKYPQWISDYYKLGENKKEGGEPL